MSKIPNLRSTEDDPEDAPWRSFAHNDLRSSNIISAPLILTPGSGCLKIETLVDENPSLMVGATNVSVSELRMFITANASHLFGPNHSGGVEVKVTGSEVRVQEVSVARNTKETSWLEHLTCFIPKEIREPWLGDLLEDRERMASTGFSQAYIKWATWIQLFSLFANRLWTKFGWGLLIYNRVSEWFSSDK